LEVRAPLHYDDAVLALPVTLAVLAGGDVEAHVVQPPQEYNDKFELSVLGAAQINGAYTRHFGVAPALSYRFNRTFAVSLMGVWNFVDESNGFADGLMHFAREIPMGSSPLVVLAGGVLAGLEVSPLVGKLTWFENHLVQFSFVVNAGAGVGFRRVQLRSSLDCTNATGTCFPDPSYGDLNPNFLAGLGGGLRVQLGELFAIRLELRDLIYPANFSTINGCNRADLLALDSRLVAGPPPSGLSSGCNLAAFSGTGPDGRSRSLDVPLATGVIKAPPASAIINNLGFYVGASLNF
jgi:hypothetical protein